jgi:hypothetical protein
MLMMQIPNLLDHIAYVATSDRDSGSGSSNDSEEDQVVSSWKQGLPSELAAIPADLLPPAQLESLHQQEAQQQQAQQQQEAPQPSLG